VLVTKIGGVVTSGIITETEAYHESEKACHAYNGRRTERTKVLFEPGGTTYVYLCYGIHCLLNVTTGDHGEAAAVLIRGIQPRYGLPHMLKRRNLEVMHPNVSAGPGKLTRALGITLQHNGRSILHDQELWIEPHKISNSNEIAVSPRIGVDYAQEDAMLPWRFFLRNSPWVSKP
jgi:DNA-3-methyladenine glycosylase